MPWKETSTMDAKVAFILDWNSQKYQMTELCARYGVSRKTAYKWVNRYLEHGPDGLWERSHAPQRSANRTPDEVEQAIVQCRLRHPSWGPKKLLWTLQRRQPQLELPSRTTVAEILKRNDLVLAKKRPRPVGHPGRPSMAVTKPNDCWSMDFKGQFRTGDGVYCYPLTVTDNHSRYLLACQGLPGTLLEPTQAMLTKVFKEYGLPSRLRSDNGVPFAAYTLGRLSRLSVWLLKLGVMPELIEPGKPQQNGRHERMHRTLKDETLKPPGANARVQQRKFNVWRREFNEDRPHEAHDGLTPHDVHVSSSRRMPSKLLTPEYPDRFEVRYVSANGGMRWYKKWVNVSSVLIGEYVGLEEVDDGQWDVYFANYRLGRLNERFMRIEDAFGKMKRRV
ncbi:IS481 family transposase [Piscinibacter gummiphilus]|uniref:IS481 family transposase n=1 Tax=Piscinibacter gummiphilus TaxID=946333 RepID=A0ABZ0CPF7_9BURK|nr:IS481 family transposase [Piscinibacter gummiphilus]WOB06859.1 IS481 family transposase [Piscinibacter gummiphilus]WOB06926.1 IS481 family transposase [Piscinibacter gummiphilus]